MTDIPIRTSSDRFYRQFLEVLRSIPPMNQLKPKSLDILAEIMHQNAIHANLPKDVRNSMIFSRRGRLELMETIGIGEKSFNNNLTVLRKHNMISKNNILNPFLSKVVFDDAYTLSFTFKLE